MVHAPAKEDLPKGYVSQEQWLAAFRGGCNQCHQLGMTTTRRYTSADDWDSIWQRNEGMNQAANRLGRELLEKTMVDWTMRVKAGEVPPAPPRPTGMERNFVVSQWDWGTTIPSFHDVTSTDKRNPTLYANGKVYGADRTGGGLLWVLDPMKNTVEELHVQPRNSKGFSDKVDYYHDRESPDAWMASPHNPMLDEQGRVWMTEPVRPPGAENNPKWSASTIAMDTTDPAAHDVAAKALLARNHGMQLGYYDTKTNKFVGVDTSFNTHHLQFDWQGRIWTRWGCARRTGYDQNRSRKSGGHGSGRAACLDACGHGFQESCSHEWLRHRSEPRRWNGLAVGASGEWTGKQVSTCSTPKRTR